MAIDAVGRTRGAASVAHQRSAALPQQPPAERGDTAELGAAGSVAGVHVPANQVSEQRLEQAIEDLSKGIDLLQRQLHFRLHKETGRLMVLVVNRETDEVIRQVPPEEVLDAAAKLRELIGLLIDERA